ncbi:MAG: ABC transporter ATP-binding protein [Clostridia bacterium]|nr:ABC transporter ATP-binding protein [Clostridia bacterium]
MKREITLAFRYASRHLWQYLLGLLSLLLVDSIITVIPRLTGQITDGLTYGITTGSAVAPMTMADVTPLVLRILVCGALVSLGRFGWRYFLLGASRSIEKEMRNDLFSHLETLSMRYYNTHKTGDLMAHFTNDLQSVRNLMGMTVITTFDASIMLIMVLYSMFRFVHPRLTFFAIMPMMLIVLCYSFFAKAMHRRFLEKQEAFSELTDHVQETVSGIRVIKAFVQEHFELAAFALKNQKTKEKNLGVVRLIALAMPLLDLIIGLSMLITLIYGGYLTINRSITVGQFVAFNSYIGMLVWPMIAVGECVSSMSQGLASLGRIRTILLEVPDISDTPDCRHDITALKGSITLDHLTFAYPDTHGVPVLQDLSVSVRAGETLAIVGHTGCGKTTVISLLERLYDPPEADMICIDGVPVSRIPLRVLHEQIACVPQDSFLFSDTIENNIAFGMDAPDHAVIESAARAACLHDNIMMFPEGYQTRIGERGVTISGGQKQRTAIARALVRNAPILILDDALSAVDTDTEEQILQNLKTLRSGKTNLIIAHRISTVQHADHILVLDHGRAAEYGTHGELLALGGIYRDLFDRQQLEKQLHQDRGEDE